MWFWNTRIYLLATLVILFETTLTAAKEEILLDTRTALSDLGWTMSPDSEWQEMTGSDATGNDLRMHMVCQITQPHQNNWLRTPYIPVNGAQRVFVEVEFTIRSCEDVPNVATCKETFNLFYYETDRDEATSTFPPWQERSYIKVDTIAADQRFQPGTENTNFETRDIGPIRKNGIYLAIQDTGACVALMHVRVYYKYCSETTQNLAVFSRTTAGPEMTSLVEATGHCVRNAIPQSKSNLPSLYCNAEGSWTVPSRQCLCSAGYQPDSASDPTTCEACRFNTYKSTTANQQCTTCPNNSVSRSRGSTECDCMYGYYRVHGANSADLPCAKPPGQPTNLYSAVNQTSLYLSWGTPLHYRGASEITYSIKCYKCQSPHFMNCGKCSNRVDYFPQQNKITQLSADITGLNPFSFYKFEVYAETDVTKVALSSGHRLNNYDVTTIETNQAAPSQVVGVRVSEVETSSLLVTWDLPTSINGQIQDYDITITGEDQSQFSNKSKIRSLKVEGLNAFTHYTVKVRARTLAGYGPYSSEVKVQTLDQSTITATNSSGDNNGTMALVAAIGAGVLIVFIVIGVLLFCRRRSRKSKLDPEKMPMYSHHAGGFGGHFASPHKTYIDPTTYEDPNRAVREFTKEIEGNFIKIEEVVGGGESGEVCRGTLQPPNKKEQEVAIKTLKSGCSTQQKLDFLGEASIMGQFDHPNVIRLEGVVTKSRPLMIITEFMENGSLDAFLRNHDNEFNVIQLVGMLRNIAAGMKYLSDMGYVHRDLAARNILVNAQLICKVSDFGMSRVLEEDSDATYTTRGGKIPIRWTAPEAFTFRKFTSASDVWSFGIVMWEVMSYGERPYWGMSNRDVMNAVESGYRLPAPMDCPQVQHRLMLECWKKDRNQRPKFGQTVASLDKMLRDPSQLKHKAGPERSRSNARLPGNQPENQPSVTTELIPKPTNHTPSSDSGLDEDSPIMTSQADTSSLGAWLEGMGMGKYKEGFNKSGCNSVEQIQQLDTSELQRIGITNKSDQELILTHAQELNRSNKRRQSGPPPYTESNLVVGIPV